MNHDSQALTAGIEDVDTTGTAAINVAFSVHLHAVWYTLSGVRTHISKQPIGTQCKGTVVLHIKGPDNALSRVVDVEDAFIGREGQAVRHDKIAHQQSQCAQVSGCAEDAGNGLLPLLPGATESPRIGEVDAAV